MTSARRPLTSLILVLITAISCGAAWLLSNNSFIPVVDTFFALVSVGALVWGLRKVYQEEAVSKPYRLKVIREGRKLIHALWAIVALLLNVVVGMIWYFSLPDFQKNVDGRNYYAYLEDGRETEQGAVEVHVRNGLLEEYVAARVLVPSGCSGSACFSKAIDAAVWQQENKNQ